MLRLKDNQADSEKVKDRLMSLWNYWPNWFLWTN